MLIVIYKVTWCQEIEFIIALTVIFLRCSISLLIETFLVTS